MKSKRDKRPVEQIRATLGGKHAYTALINPPHGWILGRADFGESGYSPVPKEFYPTEKRARARADELKSILGLTPLEAAVLVADTMRSRKLI